MIGRGRKTIYITKKYQWTISVGKISIRTFYLMKIFNLVFILLNILVHKDFLLGSICRLHLRELRIIYIFFSLTNVMKKVRHCTNVDPKYMFLLSFLFIKIHILN